MGQSSGQLDGNIALSQGAIVWNAIGVYNLCAALAPIRDERGEYDKRAIEAIVYGYDIGVLCVHSPSTLIS